MSKNSLEICFKCLYREGNFCGFDPTKSTIIPNCHYLFPALETKRKMIVGFEGS